MVLPEGVRSARAPANRWMGLGCRAPAVPTGLSTALQGDQMDRPDHASHADQVQMPRQTQSRDTEGTILSRDLLLLGATHVAD